MHIRCGDSSAALPKEVLLSQVALGPFIKLTVIGNQNVSWGFVPMPERKRQRGVFPLLYSFYDRFSNPTLIRAPLGGGGRFCSPSRIFSIAKKRRQISSTQNFQCLPQNKFDVFNRNKKTARKFWRK